MHSKSVTRSITVSRIIVMHTLVCSSRAWRSAYIEAQYSSINRVRIGAEISAMDSKLHPVLGHSDVFNV